MTTVNPVRLNHAVLFVADLERAERFYTDVIGMQVAAREPRANAAFLRLPRSGNHHDLGLFGVGAAAPPKRRGGIGLYHLAWQVDTIDELAEAQRVLADAGALTGESSHGATKSLYGADPDGNEFEIMWRAAPSLVRPTVASPRARLASSRPSSVSSRAMKE